MPGARLPDELTVQAVGRGRGDDPDAVPLADAAAAAVLADPAIDASPQAFADFLRSLPSTFRLFAAVDRDGQVRVTSGSGVFGAYADVIFVNTVPGWRGRGIGQAMTTMALRSAQDQGARQACLNATGAGLRIYKRLGFEPIGQTTLFRPA